LGDGQAQLRVDVHRDEAPAKVIAAVFFVPPATATFLAASSLGCFLVSVLVLLLLLLTTTASCYCSLPAFECRWFGPCPGLVLGEVAVTQLHKCIDAAPLK
jgi:hypothetical protein